MYAVWLVILLTAPSIDGQATDLVLTPQTLVAEYMLEATALCMPEGNPEPQELEWWGPYEREKEITDDISQRVHVKLAPNNKDLQLYIREVRPEDQGIYTCEARVNGQPIVRPLTVLVYQHITIVDAPPLQNPVINTNALIKCQVEGIPKPQVLWIRGGTENINAGGRYTYEPDGLRIENILETDNDVYMCRAYVEETGLMRSIDITVVVASAQRDRHLPHKVIVTYRQAICEYSSGNICCPDGDQIETLNVAYGRQPGSAGLCPAANTDCSQLHTVTDYVPHCNGQGCCTIAATNDDLGGDPCVGARKYAIVTWECSGRNEGV